MPQTPSHPQTGPSCALPPPPENFATPKPVFGNIPVNGKAISLFRMLFSGLVLYDLLFNILPYWDFLYGEQSTYRVGENPSTILLSVFSYSGNPVYQGFLIAVLIVSLLCMFIGFRARISAFLSFIMFMSLMDRNDGALSNIDVLVTALLLWSCFLPLDRYWSISAALRPDSVRKAPWPLVPAIAIKVQIAVVYFFSGLFKLASDLWQDGRAIDYAVGDRVYGTALGVSIVDTIPDMVMPYLTWSIIIFQLAFSFLIYFPYKNDWFRAFALLGTVVLHVSFIVLLQVHIFPAICLIYLVLLVPDHWIDAAFKGRHARLSSIRIFYDPDCGFCRAVSLILREFCLSVETAVLPASDDARALALLREHNSWVVYGHDGKIYLKWEAVSYVLSQSPIFWLLGKTTNLNILKKPMARLYDLIGRNRHRLGQTFRIFIQGKPEITPDRTLQYICLFLLSVMLIYTVATVPELGTTVPTQLRQSVRQLGVAQKWDLFAPDIASWKYKMEITATTRNGTHLKMPQILETHYKERGENLVFTSHRMLRYYRNLFLPTSQRYRQNHARYICEQMEREGRPAAMIHMTFRMEHVYEKREMKPIEEGYFCASLVRPL